MAIDKKLKVIKKMFEIFSIYDLALAMIPADSYTVGKFFLQLIDKIDFFLLSGTVAMLLNWLSFYIPWISNVYREETVWIKQKKLFVQSILRKICLAYNSKKLWQKFGGIRYMEIKTQFYFLTDLGVMI